jgi:hypothetical protein
MSNNQKNPKSNIISNHNAMFNSNVDGSSSSDKHVDTTARSSTPLREGQGAASLRSSQTDVEETREGEEPNDPSSRRDSVLGGSGTPRVTPQGKTSRLAPRKTPGAEGLCTSSTANNGIDPDTPPTQDVQKVTLKGVDYTLVTKVNASKDDKNTCNSIVQAEFYLLPSDFEGDVPRKTKRAGFLYAHIVNKKVMKFNDRRPAWIPELLAIVKQKDRPLEHPYEGGRLTELQATLKHIHDRTGVPRPDYDAHRNALTKDKVHLVTSFACEREHWGTGLAQRAMEGYERAMLQLPQAAGLQTMILSPAPLSDVLAATINPHPGREIEDRLVKSYEKSGYEVWSRQPSNVPSGFIIMGKTLGLVVEDESDDDEPIMKRFKARAALTSTPQRSAVIHGGRSPVPMRPTTSPRPSAAPSAPAAALPSVANPLDPRPASARSSATLPDHGGRKSVLPYHARTILAEDATSYLTALEPMTWVQKHRVSEGVIARWEARKRELGAR